MYLTQQKLFQVLRECIPSGCRLSIQDRLEMVRHPTGRVEVERQYDIYFDPFNDEKRILAEATTLGNAMDQFLALCEARFPLLAVREKYQRATAHLGDRAPMTLKEAAERTLDELEDHYDGAPDSKVLWMGEHIQNLTNALASEKMEIGPSDTAYQAINQPKEISPLTLEPIPTDCLKASGEALARIPEFNAPGSDPMSPDEFLSLDSNGAA